MSKLKVTNIEPQSGSIVHLTGSLVLTDTLVAREMRTELTQSVTLFQSGSTQFGDTIGDNHDFTGNVNITGSLKHTGSFNHWGDTSQVGIIESSGKESKIRFHYDSTGSLPNATTWHGMFAHVHSEGAAYFAHESYGWIRLANWDFSPNSVSASVASLSSSLQPEIAALTGSFSSSLSTRLTTAESELGNTLISGAAQIASEISGSSTSLSASLASRIASNESFSSSLDSTYATDAQLATAVSSLNAASSSYALSAVSATTGSNTFTDNQIISGTLDSNAAANKLRFLYSDFTDLPSATQYHGMFAHVHATGSAYFAHAGNWVKLANSSSFATDIASLTAVTSSYVTNVNTASFASTGSNTFTGNQIVSASVLLTLQQLTGSMPTGVATGSLIVSGSPVQLYIYNGSGSGWNRV